MTTYKADIFDENDRKFVPAKGLKKDDSYKRHVAVNDNLSQATCTSVREATKGIRHEKRHKIQKQWLEKWHYYKRQVLEKQHEKHKRDTYIKSLGVLKSE